MTMSRGPRIRFGLRNFKAFRYLEDLELKPLTLLVGANSVGKSSIFQSLLLLRQTSLGGPFDGALKFNGGWTKLGNYETVISDFDTTKELEYRFRMEGESACQFDISFGYESSKNSAKVNKIKLQDKQHEFLLTNPFTEQEEARFRSGTVEYQVDGFELRRIWVDSISCAEPWPEDADEWPGYQSLRDLFERRLQYLGPVRADPRPFYPVDEDPILGSRGKGAIPYLLRKRNDKVRYAAGPAGEIREGTLLEAMNEWLKHMQVTTSLTIEPLESVAYTAAVRSPSVTGRPVNLAQVGFGISQLLPVLILGLKNPTDGFLLFEQPEIHLHPRLQGGLGDFLIGAARAGRTVMVETHSDHLVQRIRRRIAEDTTGELADLVQILFVHPGTEEDPGSYVEPLSVDASGAIVNCPEDFFSESADEAFAILQARKTKRQTS